MTNEIEQSAEKFLHLMDRMRRLGPGAAPPMEANISPSLLTALTYAAANPGCGIQAMAVGLKLATPTISVSVRQLEKAGFLTRQPHPDDGRAVQLFLTPAGQNLHQRTLEFRRQKVGRLLDNLTIPERTTLLELLERAISAAEIEE